ncbi:MAG: chorismate mutase [Clostridiales bacterium]|nr:chorismate mutase [Candidatus Blautia equi]
MDELKKLRAHLDLCDEIILDALLMRNKIIEDITIYKQDHDMKIVQPKREEKRRKNLVKRMKGADHQDLILEVFDTIVLNGKKIQSSTLFDSNIVLIGFMGCGKTTISKTLKKMFAMEVIEMDQVIAEQEGMSIPEIFEIHGEEYFRNAETKLLIDMQDRKNVVISCGGGTAMRDVNVAEMKKNGKVVLLTAEPETVLERVKNSHDRPLLENNKTVEFIAELMNKRRAKYEAAADIIIHTDNKSAFQICEEIIARVREA